MERYKCKTFQYKKAQQLVEFLLVVPFMIIILGILTEYAYALNINMTLKEGLKTATASIYSQIKPGMGESDIRAIVVANLKDYLTANNVPVNSENITDSSIGYAIVGKANMGQMAVFMASYTYIPSFTLPNVYFHFLPDKFTFFATSAVPGAFLNPSSDYGNAYGNSTIDSLILDKIWSASDFASLTFNGIKNGVLKDKSGSSNLRANVLFLIPSPSTPGTYIFIYDDGTVPDCSWNSAGATISGSGCGSFNGGKFIDYLKTYGFYNVIFVQDSDLNNLTSNLSNLSSYWVYDNSSGTAVPVPTANVDNTDLSVSNIDGILKRSLALITASTPSTPSTSRGNYDDNTTIKTFGSIVFVGSGDPSNITAGASPPSITSFPSGMN